MKSNLHNASLLAVFCLLPLALPTASAARSRHYEKIEWTWTDRPAEINRQLPNVLLFGDSITRAYYDGVAQKLKGRANVYLFATSASVGDGRLTRQVADYMNMVRTKFSVIHVNNGMHGNAYATSEYRRYYPELLMSLARYSPLAKCVVATTTPVRNAVPDFPSNSLIDSRNVIATDNAKRFGCDVDDQHALMLNHQDLHSDDIHFTETGSALQAEQVANIIEAHLPKEAR